MERLDVFDCSNVLIASYFTDDRGCAHENREHTLIYLCSGELEIEERGKKTVLHPGDCAFMRRDNRMWLQKKVEDGKPYRSVVLKFSRPFLREFYQTLNRQQIPNVRRQACVCCPVTGLISVRCSNPSFPISMQAKNRPKTY